MMKTGVLYFLCALTSILAASPTFAGEKILVSGRAPQLERFRATVGKKLKTEPVFSDSERAFLRSRGRADLAETLQVDLGKEKATDLMPELRKKIRNRGLGLKIEVDQKVKLRQVGSDPLMKDVWGIQNDGLPRKMFLSNFNSLSIPGIKGEDVNVLGTNTREGKGIVVAVLDSGVDVNHPELTGNIRRKNSECANLARYQKCLEDASASGKPASKCDDEFMKLDTDGNGYPMDCEGWSFIGKKNKVSKQYGGPIVREAIPDAEDGIDSTGHGTKVAGIIAAASNNSIGIRGIAPQAKILPIQITKEKPGTGGGTVGDDDSASALISTVARGMVYAVAEKADVANLSLGWNGRADSQLMRDAVKLAQDQGMIVVAAAGNDSTDALVYPCQYEGVICVASHDPDGKISEFSNFGSGVDLAAPGFAILSTVQDDVDPNYFTDRQGYDFDRGTSFASPFVAGAAAILRSQGLSPEETTARLLVGARRKPYSEGKVVLAGNLDVRRALSLPPQPYFVPLNKGIYPTIWNRATNRAELAIDLKNIWKDAGKTSVRLSLSERDRNLGQLRLSKNAFTVLSWKKGESKTLTLNLEVLDPRITSDATLVLEIQAMGASSQVIRIPLQISVVLDEKGALPNARTLPVSGAISPDAVLFSVTALDGRPEQDYVAVEKGETDWKIQIVRETRQGDRSLYIAGPVKAVTLPENASPRITQRLDVNLDGKADYVFTSYVPSDENHGIPFFRFDYRDENGNDVLPSYTFKNKTTVLQLDRFQWLRSGNRLVPAWADVGNTPEAEKIVRYDPWNPLQSDEEAPRLYFHDDQTPDGVRSIKIEGNTNTSVPSELLFLGLLKQSAADRKTGKVAAILTEQGEYVARFFIAEIDEARAKLRIFPLESTGYRNLRSLDPVKTYALDPNAVESSSGTAYAGVSGTQVQRISAIVKSGDRYLLLDQRIPPPASSDNVYKTIAAYIEGSASARQGVAAYAQANYDLLYRDSTTDRTLSTSLRRYTFLSAALFERSFISAVAESQGERLGAIQIPDGFGAYPGAEVIAPLRRAGVSVDLVRPAALRIQLATDLCEWLSRTEPTAANPSEAVYFCKDRFIRVPYRF